MTYKVKLIFESKLAEESAHFGDEKSRTLARVMVGIDTGRADGQIELIASHSTERG